MRCLTVRQPWATLIACGSKSIEVRSWTTRYRGPIAVLAGRGRDIECAPGIEYPAGVVVCMVDLLDIRKLRAGDRPKTGLGGERFADALSADSFAWQLSAPRRCAPLEIRGTLGLITLPQEAILRLAAT